LRYERLNYNISESPLNPPILGDFEVRRPPKIGGLGGEFIPEFSNVGEGIHRISPSIAILFLWSKPTDETVVNKNIWEIMFYQDSGYSAWVGSPPLTQLHGALDVQKM
jgi:hypothetical protein